MVIKSYSTLNHDPSLSHPFFLLVRRTLKSDLTPEEAQALDLEAYVTQV